MSDVIDISAPRSGYRPVRATFNGQEYVFGRSALGVFQAVNLGGDLPQKEGENKPAYVARVLRALPELVKALCPEFPDPPWAVDEEVGLFQTVMEVLKRSGEIRFQAE